MKKLASLLLVSAALHAQPLLANTNEQQHADAVFPSKAVELLLEGNENFYQKGEVKHLDSMVAIPHRKEVADGQKPFAVIIGCSDSRLSPELIFDKGLGEIFVIRVAGNIIDPHELGSVEYAVEHLGAKLVMVLGHERCGAVTAAYDAHVSGKKVEGNIGSLVDAIEPAISKSLAHNATGKKEEIIDRCINENVNYVAEQLEVRSPILKEAAEKGTIQIVKAYYDLHNGKVTLIQ